MTEQTDKPGVYASAAIKKEDWGPFSKSQARIICNAAAVIGAVAGQDFVASVFSSIKQPVDDATFAYALKQLLAEHDSEDLVEQIFRPTTGVHYAEISQR
jgi:hypothetical protein